LQHRKRRETEGSKSREKKIVMVKLIVQKEKIEIKIKTHII
jgi:hypothetical protein